MSLVTAGKQVTVGYWNARVVCIGYGDTSDPGTHEVRLFADGSNYVLKVWNGTQWIAEGLPDEVKPDRMFYSEPIDKNNDIQFEFLAPSSITSVKMHLRGLNFPTWPYTEYGPRPVDVWTDDGGAQDGHQVSISGTTDAETQTHYHVVNCPAEQGSHNSQNNSATHTHGWSKSFTTSNHPAHNHRLNLTLPGKTQKTTFAYSLLQVFISTTPASWGTAKTIDLSALYSTTGTGLIDITSYITAGQMNFIKLHLNTTSDFGGKVNIYIEIK